MFEEQSRKIDTDQKVKLRFSAPSAGIAEIEPILSSWLQNKTYNKCGSDSFCGLVNQNCGSVIGGRVDLKKGKVCGHRRGGGGGKKIKLQM